MLAQPAGAAREYLERSRDVEDLRSLPDPPLAKQLALLLEHYRAILEHYGVQHGVKIARKHVAWYSKGLYGSNEFRTRINFMDDPKDVEAAILDFYTPQIERAAA